MSKKLSVAILIFEEVEVLDFAGPFEVFSVTSELSDYTLLEVKVVGKNTSPVIAKNGLKVIPDVSYSQVEQMDVLVIPGGDGSKSVLMDQDLMNWLGKVIPKTQVTFSVCSGARILAKLGLLDGKPFATHHEVYEDVLALTQNGIAQRNMRFVDLGQVMTAAGVSSGVDLSLHVVQKLFGQLVMEKTARYIEWSGIS